MHTAKNRVWRRLVGLSAFVTLVVAFGLPVSRGSAAAGPAGRSYSVASALPAMVIGKVRLDSGFGVNPMEMAHTSGHVPAQCMSMPRVSLKG